jgi:hypothetical protein
MALIETDPLTLELCMLGTFLVSLFIVYGCDHPGGADQDCHRAWQGLLNAFLEVLQLILLGN